MPAPSTKLPLKIEINAATAKIIIKGSLNFSRNNSHTDWWGGSAIYAAHNNSKSVSGDNGVIGNDASTYLSDQAYNNMVFTDGHVGPQRTLDVFGSEGLQMGAAYDLWFGGN